MVRGWGWLRGRARRPLERGSGWQSTPELGEFLKEILKNTENPHLFENFTIKKFEKLGILTIIKAIFEIIWLSSSI